MDMTNERYGEYVRKKARRSPLLRDCTFAFAIGGAICAVGEAVRHAWSAAGLSADAAATATSCSLVLLSAILTALNLYNKLARYGGAGTLVPITGFANAVVSPAIDYRAEGLITGTAVKMFSIAGPVIVYGIAASAVYGAVLAALGG